MQKQHKEVPSEPAQVNWVIITTLQVQALIGAKRAVAFDVTAACSGFVIGVVTAAQFMRTGMYKNVLVIGADALSRYVDWRDRGEIRVRV